MKILELKKNKEMGLYDNRSKDQNSVVAEKVIDVTDICPKSDQCVIKYASVTRGMLAQIQDRYEKDKDIGMTVHYHINEMTVVELANDEVFERQAVMMGSHPMELAKIIFDNQPQKRVHADY